ncbi:MAG: DUF3592 domain-containing protein [Propionibacteriaceae bacterium]
MRWLRFPRVLGVMCALYFLAMAVLFGNMSIENTEFSANAHEVPGTVVAMVATPLPGGSRVPAGSRRREPMAPTVQYVVDGQTYTYTPARGTRHPKVKVGDTVMVLYDTGDPAHTARIAGEGKIALPLITIGFLASTIGLGVLLVLTRPGRRHRGPGATRSGSPRPGAPTGTPTGTPPAGDHRYA